MVSISVSVRRELDSGYFATPYTINGKRREYSFGRYPDMSFADAGSEVATLKAGIKKGIDPLAERHRADKTVFKTVDDLAEDWLKDCEKRLKHPNIPRRVYTKDVAPYIGKLGIAQVTPMLASEGVPGHVAERVLNHKLKGVEGIYDRYDYIDERGQALELIAKKLAPVINQSSAKVFEFQSKVIG